MYARIRRLGYLALAIDCGLKDHRIGVKRWVWLIERPVDYESPWRYYYIVRNSTVLLMEGSIDLNLYLRQLRNFDL